MASSALEAKINKIRQQNEEIRRRYEEVEEDKKNAAKLNALVQMVPSTDWPERKEPPEFSNPPKTKPKVTKEKQEYISHPHPNEGKKIHSFAQGEGPPPDPKYNFLADSEREEPSADYGKETSGNRSHNRVTRGSFRKKTGGRETVQKDNRTHKGNFRDESQPGYDAWRAERNRIDEDRISRQRTAEGNWRREWDNDKMHIVDDIMKKLSRSSLGDFAKKDHKDPDRRYYTNNNEHPNHNRGGSRPHRGAPKNFYGNYDNRPHNTYDQPRNNSVTTKTPLLPPSDERTVVATDKSLKVTVNQSNANKGPVMSVKVNSPSIAGTGRVGPRQRTRVTYSHSDAEAPMSEGESFHRQKSFEDKSKGNYFNNQKSPNIKRSHSQKKKDSDTKYPYNQKKDDGDHHENEFRSQKSYYTKSPKPIRGNSKTVRQVSNVDSSGSNEIEDCSNRDAEKIEDCVTAENNETVEASETIESDQIEANNTDKEELHIENEVKNEITEAVPVKETEETCSSPIVENSEHIAESNNETNILDEKNERSEELVNNLTKDLQENVEESSKEFISGDVRSEEEQVLTESNSVSDDIKLEDSSNKDDEQSFEQVSEQSNGDCDNIKANVTAEESAQDNSTASLEDKTNSVIETTDQLVSNGHSKHVEPLKTEERTEDNEKSPDTHTENTVEVNTVEVNTVSEKQSGENEKIEQTMEVL